MTDRKQDKNNRGSCRDCLHYEQCGAHPPESIICDNGYNHYKRRATGDCDGQA